MNMKGFMSDIFSLELDVKFYVTELQIPASLYTAIVLKGYSQLRHSYMIDAGSTSGTYTYVENRDPSICLVRCLPHSGKKLTERRLAENGTD